MLATEQADLAGKLKSPGYALTSFSEMGLEFDTAKADSISSLCGDLAGTADRVLAKESGTVVAIRDSDVKDLALSISQPVVSKLFPGEHYEQARQRANLFRVAYYEEGDTFAQHRDFNLPTLATAVIMTMSGIRRIHIGGERFDEKPGSVFLIDGGVNPEHSASCRQGPSVAIVVDVPELMY